MPKSNLDALIASVAKQFDTDLSYLVCNSTQWYQLEYGDTELERIYGIHRHFYEILIQSIESWLN
jgi:hypothetical protein